MPLCKGRKTAAIHAGGGNTRFAVFVVFNDGSEVTVDCEGTPKYQVLCVEAVPPKESDEAPFAAQETLIAALTVHPSAFPCGMV